MNYDFRLAQTGIKRMYLNYGNPIINSFWMASLLSLPIGGLYIRVIVKNIDFFQKNWVFPIIGIAFILISRFHYKKRVQYIQWDERNIRFKNIKGYSAIIGVDRIKSIKIKRGKGIYITHDNFIDKTRNGTYLIPFDPLVGRNYNIDVDIITEDFKKLYPDLILKDKEL